MSDRMEIRHIGELGGNLEGEEKRGIREGLTSSPKDISWWPKYLYDERGSELFKEITEQPEYYQTRTELSILRGLSESGVLGRFDNLIELGSGSASKTRALLDAAVGSSNGNTRYIPLDISESALRESAESLLEEYPSLSISGYVGDFDGAVGDFLGILLESEGPRLIIFLGGTIGNFSANKRADFLRGVRQGLSEGDRLLVGMDLVKSREVLEAAYDDEAGVTSAFNKNVLSVLNRQLGADFDPGLFLHRAVFDSEYSRVEMWLDSMTDQNIHIPGLDLDINISKGEGIRTELSHKFTVESARGMFEATGMGLVDLYMDDEELFGLALARPE